MQHDYSGHEEEASPDQMAQLHILADQLDVADAEVEQLETALEEAKKRRTQIRENDMPDLMQAIGLEEFRTTNGTKFVMRKEIRASFFAKDKSKREPAFAWLKEHGHDGLIKNTVVATFTREQEQLADKFVEFAKTFDAPMNIAQNKDIHPQTLVAFLKERLREGEEVPLKLFGAAEQKIVKVERPK